MGVYLNPTKSARFAIFILFISVLEISSVVDAEACQIEEGYVGLQYKDGVLQEEIFMPGVRMERILVRPEEATLPDVEAITKDGIEITFPGISVMSRVNLGKITSLVKKFGTSFKQDLLHVQIKESLRNICANHTLDYIYSQQFLDLVPAVKDDVVGQLARLADGGVELINLAIRKPTIPADIAENYRMVKLQWTQQLVEVQKQKSEMIKKETETMKAIADAKIEKDILERKIENEVLNTEGQKIISEIKNKILKDEQKNLADIAKYAKEVEAEANKALLTPEYVKMKVAESLANNAKLFFSGKDTALGGTLEKILDE